MLKWYYSDIAALRLRLAQCSRQISSAMSITTGGMNMAAFTVQELESMIVVYMGDYKTSRGETKLMTKDLGSCIGVAVRDPHVGVEGFCM